MNISDLVIIVLILAVCGLAIWMMRPGKEKEKNNLNAVTSDRRKKMKRLLNELNITMDLACQESGMRRPVTMGEADFMISWLQERKQRAQT